MTNSNVSGKPGLVHGSGSPAPYEAAEYCDGLSAHGYEDWYLPAQDELNVLYINRINISGFTSSSYYWSSSEEADNNARYQQFSGSQTDNRKDTTGVMVRCVRKQDVELTQIVPDGLIGHWRLDETSGTTIYDSSGSENHGSLNGNLAVYPVNYSVNSPVGTTFERGPSPSDVNAIRVEVEDVFPTGANQPFSVTMWLKRASPSESVFANGNHGTPSPEPRQIGVIGENLRIFNPGPDPSIDFNENFNEWRHIAVTYDGTAIRGYLNGVNTGGALLSTTITSDDFIFGGFGGSSGGGGADFDDVRLYNRPLNINEIREVYNARDGIRYNTAHRVPEYFDGNKFVPMRTEFPDMTNGLVGHWKLDETEGTTVVNSANPGTYDGTMQNGMDAADDTQPGAVGTAMHFNAPEDQYIDLGGAIVSSITTGQATFAAWMKLRSDISTFSRIFDYGNMHTMNINPNSGGRLQCAHTGATTSTHGSNLYDRNELTHVACVFHTDGTIENFVNGVSIGSVNTPSFSFDFSAGDTGKISSPVFNPTGIIDDVRMYDRALSPAEMMLLYRMGTPVGSSTALPQGCPTIGDVCDDGTIYAGFSLADGTTPLYITTDDAPGTYDWNDGSGTGAPTTSATSEEDGEANTSTIVTFDADEIDAGFQLHDAAHYCFTLVSNGADDWYLPARFEYGDFYNGGNFIGDFDTSNRYWTSTETTSSSARSFDFSNGSTYSQGKNYNFNVRCVRKGPAPRCANPYGMEGSMIYNTTHDVTQYCDGARWVAIGKRGP